MLKVRINNKQLIPIISAALIILVVFSLSYMFIKKNPANSEQSKHKGLQSIQENNFPVNPETGNRLATYKNGYVDNPNYETVSVEFPESWFAKASDDLLILIPINKINLTKDDYTYNIQDTIVLTTPRDASNLNDYIKREKDLLKNQGLAMVSQNRTTQNNKTIFTYSYKIVDPNIFYRPNGPSKTPAESAIVYVNKTPISTTAHSSENVDVFAQIVNSLQVVEN